MVRNIMHANLLTKVFSSARLAHWTLPVRLSGLHSKSAIWVSFLILSCCLRHMSESHYICLLLSDSAVMPAAPVSFIRSRSCTRACARSLPPRLLQCRSCQCSTDAVGSLPVHSALCCSGWTEMSAQGWSHPAYPWAFTLAAAAWENHV